MTTGNDNNLQYIATTDAEVASFNLEVYRLTRPTSLGESNVSTHFFTEWPHDTLPHTAVGFPAGTVNIPIHASADTTTLSTIFSAFVTASLCTAADRTNALNAINAAKGTTVNLSTVFPATMWTNKMNEAAYEAWAALT